MQYIVGAIVLVAALVGGLFYLSDDGSVGDVAGAQEPSQSTYQEIAAVDVPDYANVVADEARRAELENDAAAFLDQLTGITRSRGSSADDGHGDGEPRAFDFVDAKRSMLVVGRDNIQVEEHSVPLRRVLASAGKQVDKQAYYFMHKVNANDGQGVWGIVQAKLIKRFADGVAMSREEDSDQYQILIPQDADERLDSGSSSFLGKVLYHKVKESLVYNIWADERRFARDVIVAEQDIVIIPFTHEELVGIYQYFVTQSH